MLLMGYLNPLLAYGPEAFAAAARSAGADGVIVPDLPPEESDLIGVACAGQDLALVAFLAPTSTDRRIALAAERATGFIYLVSVTGVTGARSELPPGLEDFIAQVRAQTDKPLVLGFGISQPEQARRMNALVDGFIVGSALVKPARLGYTRCAIWRPGCGPPWTTDAHRSEKATMIRGLILISTG